ncbi:MAG: DMT family transporter [Planctomycetota bacterium]
MAYLQFTLICLFFGSNFILMDRASRYFGPVEIGAGRLASAIALLGAVWLASRTLGGGRRGRLRWSDAPNLLLVGLIANAYPYAAQPALIGQGFGHSFFGMTVAFVPLLTILVSIPLLGVKPTARQLVGVLGGLGMIALLMYDGNQRGMTPTLLAIAVTVPLSYAVGNTWLRRTLADAPPTPLATVMMAFALLTLSPLWLSVDAQTAIGAPPPAVRTDPLAATAALVALGAIGTGACAYLFVRLVQTEGPLFAGMVTYVVPVIALLWGLVDRETITTRQLVAIAGILAMVALVQAPQRTIKEAQPTPDTADDWNRDAAPVEA